jgi:hypothetical protein
LQENSFYYLCTPNPKGTRENKFLFYDSVAQLVEQYTFNVWVLGSSPNGITFKNESLRESGGFFVLGGDNYKFTMKDQVEKLGDLEHQA